MYCSFVILLWALALNFISHLVKDLYISLKPSLVHSAGCGRPEIVAELLHYGVVVDPIDAERKTPLQLCIELKENNWQAVTQILQ